MRDVALLSWLETSRAHHDIVTWARAHAPSWSQFWAECPRGDWMIGIAARAGVDGKVVVASALKCLPVLSPYLPPGDATIERAIATAHAYVVGDAFELEQARTSVSALLERCADPSTHASVLAVSALLDAIEQPESAASVVVAAVQAAVMDAGDCAMISAARFTEHECARLVREAIDVSMITTALHA